MGTSRKVTVTEVDEALAEGDVRGLGIIQLALVGSILSYLAVVAVLALAREPPEQPRPGSFLLGLSAVHALLAVTAFGLSFAIAPVLLNHRNAEKLAERSPSGADARTYLGMIRGAWIARLALQEGAALFGVTVCLLAVLDGAAPLYWLNALSAALFILSALMTLPSRERLLATFEERFSRRV